MVSTKPLQQPNTIMNNQTPDNPKKRARRYPKRVDPFSPWQVLIRDRCVELKISTRALASKVATARKRYDHTTIWAWLHSPEGTPGGDVYSSDLNNRLAAALEISPTTLADAFELSRRKFVLSTASVSQQGPLSVLRTLFADSQRKTWKTEQIVKLIDDIRGV